MSKRINAYATPTIPDPGKNVEKMVTVGQSHIASISNSPEYGQAPAVQQATDAWNTETAALAALNGEITDLTNKMAMAVDARRTTIRRWKTRKGAVLTAINNHCDGSKAKLVSFGVGVLGMQPRVPAEVPQNLRHQRTKTPTTVKVVWTPQKDISTYMVQYATDPANPATYSPQIPSSRAQFQLTGQPLGGTLHFRVLAIDPALPTGQTDYTPWLAVKVGS